MESSEGYISYDRDRYVLAGRQGLDDHLLAAGDDLKLSTSGRRQAVCVARGEYRGWYYITADGQRARFALCMKARLASQKGLEPGKGGVYGEKRNMLAGLWSDCVRVVAGVRSTVHDTVFLPALVSKGGGLMATENIEIKVQGNTLVITVDLSKTYGLSVSGKSEVIASTGGNVAVPGRDEVKVGLNVFRPQKRLV